MDALFFGNSLAEKSIRPHREHCNFLYHAHTLHVLHPAHSPSMPVDHYENFPVASILLPRRLHAPVQTIYAFARSADDLADEGDATPEQRLTALAAYRDELDRIASEKTPQTQLFQELAQVINNYRLPFQPFQDLLSAFEQDVTVTRYASYDSLLDYCQRSANPVGILMLHLYEHTGTGQQHAANAICSALQLINFWQDVAIDWQKQRIYIPREDMQAFNVSEQHIATQTCDAAWQSLMQFETERARTMLLSGAPLALQLPGRIGWELRLIVQGGLRILEALEQANYDVFRHRPELGPRDWLLMLWRAIRMKQG